MAPESLLPCWKEHVICPLLEPYDSSTFHLILFKIHFNIIVSCTPMSSKRYLSLEFAHQNPSKPHNIGLLQTKTFNPLVRQSDICSGADIKT